ncbi:hypothetical protein CU098_010719 [Rhizopus stolonifer]|uniref:Uncharacterized protein n=1 Tax=Rhizopus stolonifer TaxID=4846 RepID=A0A367KLR0_RHIST|nr:hypothetical protein CU098_010719 [Rhizopus stolonifer]
MSFIFSTTTARLFSRESSRERVADWIGSGKRAHLIDNTDKTTTEPDHWKDVHKNIKQMDQFYDATFHAWLKSEENVLVTSIYLHRIANEYPLERIINALEWLTIDWRWESTSILVRHVTVDWTDDEGDKKRATLLLQLTHNWATQFIATLITTILISSPYSTSGVKKRERFLKEFTKDWDFSKLSEFFMFLKSRANIDYKFKCALLKEAASRDGPTNKARSEPGNNSNNNSSSNHHYHHRRTSSNDFKEIKLTILDEMDGHHHTETSLENESNLHDEKPTTNTTATEESNGLQLFGNRCYSSAYINSASSTSSASLGPSSSTTTSSSSLLYHHHHTNTHGCRLTAPSSGSSSSSNHDIIPSPSTSSSDANNDKKRLTSATRIHQK